MNPKFNTITYYNGLVYFEVKSFTVCHEFVDNALQTIILTQYSVHSSDLGFHVYRNNWQPKTGEILEMRIGPEEKYAVAVIDKESRIIGHLLKVKGTSKKYVKTIFFFFFSDGLNICLVKLLERLGTREIGKV